MQIIKMSKSFLVLLTLLTSLNSYAQGYKFSCDNEHEESTAGQVFYQVEGSLNPADLTLANVTLALKEVTFGDDKLLGQTTVNTLNPKSQDQNAMTYSFNGTILGRNQNVKITFQKNVVRGLTYNISVNNSNLRWCIPLYK